MFPFRDHNPSSTTPYVTWALIAINIVVFLLYFTKLSDEVALSSIWDNWAMIPGEISAGIDYHTLLTSMFLHGGFMHIVGNMLFLWIFGDNVEDAMGHIPFLLFYLVCGLGADAFHWMADPQSAIPTVGASGAIAGVMGAYLFLYPKARVDVLLIMVIIFRMFTWPAWVVLGAWMVMQIFGGFATGTLGGGVAYWAHVGGFVVGLALVFPLWLKLGGSAFWARSEFHPPNPPTFEEPSKTIHMLK